MVTLRAPWQWCFCLFFFCSPPASFSLSILHSFLLCVCDWSLEIIICLYLTLLFALSLSLFLFLSHFLSCFLVSVIYTLPFKFPPFRIYPNVKSKNSASDMLQAQIFMHHLSVSFFPWYLSTSHLFLPVTSSCLPCFVSSERSLK